MATDKDQLHALLADYVEGSLSEQQIEEAEAYLAANPGVRSVVDKLMIDSEALRALPSVRSPVDHSEEIRGAAERDLLLSDAPDGGKRPFSGPTFALAALLFVTLGLGGAAYWILTNRPTTSFDFASTVGTTTAPTAAAETKGDVAVLAKAEGRVLFDEASPGQPAAAKAAPLDGEAGSPAPASPAPLAAIAPGSADERTRATADRSDGVMRAQGRIEETRVVEAEGGRVDPHFFVRGEWPRELEVPASVQAIIDAAPVEGGRPALAVVVNDVAALDAMRKLVRDNVGLEHQAQNVFEKVNDAQILAATMPIDLGPLVATNVTPEMVSRIRTAIAASHAASAFDITPARAANAAPPVADRDVATSQPAQGAHLNALQQNAMRQELSGLQNQAPLPQSARADGPTSRSTNVDIFVVLVPAAAPTTMPAE